jgi:MYXO-CTERM domain-containing protein
MSISRMTTYALLALGLMVGLAAEARAETITTPAGVAPGGSFIFVFYDSTIGNAESTNIATYNALIATAASGITYSGGTIGTWQIIGATASADPAAALFSSSLPVYQAGLVGGVTFTETKLASSGSAWLASGVTPNYNQNGTPGAGRPTWTGLQGEFALAPGVPGGENGQPATGYTLGSSSVESGNTDEELSLGGLDGNSNTANNLSGNYYGFAIFTAAEPVPEPGTFTLAFAGLVAVGAFGLVRRRRAGALAA